MSNVNGINNLGIIQRHVDMTCLHECIPCTE